MVSTKTPGCDHIHWYSKDGDILKVSTRYYDNWFDHAPSGGAGRAMVATQSAQGTFRARECNHVLAKKTKRRNDETVSTGLLGKGTGFMYILKTQTITGQNQHEVQAGGIASHTFYDTRGSRDIVSTRYYSSDVSTYFLRETKDSDGGGAMIQSI